MQRFIIPFLCGLLFFAASCGTTRMLTSGVTANQVDEVLFLRPLTIISLIEKGNRGTYDSVLSVMSEQNVTASLKEHIPERVRLVEQEFDPVMQYSIDSEIHRLIVQVENRQSIRNIRIPPLLDSLMSENETRYALCVFQDGFSRTKSNYGKQVAQGIMVGILTLGHTYYTPIKAYSTLICCIVDRQNQNIAFYRRKVREAEPTDPQVIESQIEHILDPYFFPK